MRISFPYPDMSPMDIPEQEPPRNLLPFHGQIEKSEEEIIEEAFSHPIGSPPLIRNIERVQGRF